MHARIDQLLNLLDGTPVDAAVRVHVQQCTQCLAESARLGQTRAALQALPQLEPPGDAWEQIQARASQRTQRRAQRRAVLGLAAAVAVLAVGALAFVTGRESVMQPRSDANATISPVAAVAPNSADLDRLIARSQQLDAVLGQMPRPQVERVSLAATVDSIEQRIQWLDYQLAYEPDADLSEHQAQRLWSERVALMDSLVKVRYAESTPLIF